MKSTPPQNHFAYSNIRYKLNDEFSDFQYLISGAHMAESKQKSSSTSVTIPVSNVEVFQRNKDEFEKFFEWLTDRSISLEFISRKASSKQTTLSETSYYAISLYSGGLDSGSLPLSNKYINKKLLLHHTHTNNKLYNVAKKLHKKCNPPQHGLIITNMDLVSTADIPLLHIRGAIFLTNLMAVAAHYNIKKIIIPENGPFMINYPVSMSVIPTKTTNPDMIERLSNLFKSMTNTKFTIETPYIGNTKAEVILSGKNPKLIQNSWSCTSTQNLDRMCGLCTACFVRQVSLHAINLSENLKKQYKFNPFLIKKNGLKITRNKSFRILIDCLEFWKNLICSDLAPTKLESERYNHIVKRYPMLYNHATEMYLGIKNYCKHNSYDVLGEIALENIEYIDDKIEKRRSVLEKKYDESGGNETWKA